MQAKAIERPLVVVAMSGGVDSSVAAALLHEEGDEVVGVHLRLADPPDRPEERNPRACCAAADVSDVRRVARSLGVAHYVLDYRARFEEAVVRPFVEAYARGQTPNPCLACNHQIKFGPLLEQARRLGARALATGHYARIRRDASGHHHLHQARDRAKDQSYFLYRLDQATLAHLTFPLGDLDKSEVRALARRFGLPTATKEESQEICFVGRAGYARLVEDRLGPQPGGEITDAGGRVLAYHGGIHRFTIGQRRRLGIGGGGRRYVTAIDPERRRVEVGPREALARTRLVIGDLSWVSGRAPEAGRPLRVCVRYRDPGRPGALVAPPDGGRATLRLETPVDGAAPGQAVVLYEGDEVLGGGTLEEARP